MKPSLRKDIFLYYIFFPDKVKGPYTGKSLIYNLLYVLTAIRPSYAQKVQFSAL